MKRNPYQIQSFISVADFPAKITKPYAHDALKIIEEEINSAKVKTIRAKGEYLKAMQEQVEKFERFKKFIQGKLKELNDAEFKKLTGKAPEVSKVADVANVADVADEPEVADETEVAEAPIEKPKKRSRKKKTSKTVVEKVKDVFSENKGEIE